MQLTHECAACSNDDYLLLLYVFAAVAGEFMCRCVCVCVCVGVCPSVLRLRVSYKFVFIYLISFDET